MEGTSSAGGGRGDIYRLPEGCVSHVLSLTSPRDTCRSAAVSSTFRSAAESDVVWERFLPPDYQEILSRSVAPVEFASKRELFFRLCDSILVDDGKKSFALERSTGKKCYMLSAKELQITWGDTPRYWKWFSLPESRFSEVAELLQVCWLEIHGRIASKVLSPKTTYVAYLIFKLSDRSHGFRHPNQEALVKVGAQASRESVCVQPEEGNGRWHGRRRGGFGFPPGLQPPETQEKREVPRVRGDGWMEIVMGEFFNDEGDDGEVDICLMEIKGGHWKTGLIVQGIEVRPKKQS